jgi:hypothetical protein
MHQGLISLENENEMKFCLQIAVIKLWERTDWNGESIKGRVYWILKKVMIKHNFFHIYQQD